MKHVTFTYHMTNFIEHKEVAETCTTIYVSDELCKEKHRDALEDSLNKLSYSLAMLAGYDNGEFCCIDEIED